MNTYIWKSLVLGSIEYASITEQNASWKIESTVLVTSEKIPGCKIQYSIKLDKNWELDTAVIEIDELGSKKVLIIELDENKNWIINKKRDDSFSSCTDLDLGFSPMTNTIPIRRFALKKGNSAALTACWVQFPSFKLKPLEQKYTCIDDNTYLYESGTTFKATLQVDNMKIVKNFPSVWQMIATNQR